MTTLAIVLITLGLLVLTAGVIGDATRSYGLHALRHIVWEPSTTRMSTALFTAAVAAAIIDL